VSRRNPRGDMGPMPQGLAARGGVRGHLTHAGPVHSARAGAQLPTGPDTCRQTKIKFRMSCPVAKSPTPPGNLRPSDPGSKRTEAPGHPPQTLMRTDAERAVTHQDPAGHPALTRGQLTPIGAYRSRSADLGAGGCRDTERLDLLAAWSAPHPPTHNRPRVGDPRKDLAADTPPCHTTGPADSSELPPVSAAPDPLRQAVQLMDPNPAHRAPQPHPEHPVPHPGLQPHITPYIAGRLRDVDAHGCGANRCAPRSKHARGAWSLRGHHATSAAGLLPVTSDTH